MTATEELRRLLDERGVEHYDGTESTLWLKDEHGYRASADELSSGRLSVHIWCDTTEQAIAATLGGGTCHVESMHGYTDPFASTRYSVELSCHTLEDWPDREPPEYCPNCGAKVVEQ